MNPCVQKKTLTFLNKSQLSKKDGFEANLNFWNRLSTGTFSIKLTQFEKNGSTGIVFNSLGNLKIKFYFCNQKSIAWFMKFTLLLFYSRVSHSFNTENYLNLKNLKTKPIKSKIEPEQILRVFLKKIIATWNKKQAKTEHKMHNQKCCTSQNKIKIITYKASGNRVFNYACNFFATYLG